MVASTTSWSGRTWFGLAVFNDKMWIFGGASDSPIDRPVIVDGVFYSTDGITWPWINHAGVNAYGQNGLVFDGKLWAVGEAQSHWTLDGDTWTDITRGIGSFYRAEAVFADKMWLLGGKNYDPEGGERYHNYTFSSVDGANWTSKPAPWSQFGGVMALVFAGKLWILGGGMARVWYSSDGITWQQAQSDAPWGVRYFPAAAVADGKMWILGGNRDMEMDGEFLNDVWCTSDGVNWTEVTPATAWCPRGGHRALVYKNKLWVMGGVTSNSRYLNDVWNTDLPPPPPPLTITESPRGGWVEASNLWKFSAAATGGSGLKTYQWKKDGAAIYGAMDSTYDIASLASSDTGWYVCTITDGMNSTVSTTPVYLQVFPYDSLPVGGAFAAAAFAVLLSFAGLYSMRRHRIEM